MKKKTKLLIRDAFFSTLLSCLLILLLALLLSLRFFNPLHKAFTDFSFLDVFYSESFQGTDKINPQIILVNVGDSDRSAIAKGLQAILKEDPRTVGVDIIFKERKDNVQADSLLASLLVNDSVVTSFNIVEDIEEHNHPYFGNNENAGYVNFNFDEDVTVIREFIGHDARGNRERLSFANQITKHALKEKWQSLNYNEKLRKSQVIKFQGAYDAFIHMDLDDIKESSNPVFKDKIVILGYLGSPTGYEKDILDKYFTPLNQYCTGRSDADMFGTTIHANIINMLITKDFMLKISNFWLAVITFLVMFFSTMFYMKINRKYKVSYRTRKRIYQFITCVFVLLFSFWLFRLDVVLKPSLIIVGIILAGSYFKYYKHLTRYLKTKSNRKWKTYLK
ncbi:MAG: CHASE2 domain-containing protein [Bacteroidia bacterium]|nr:CHASE2 domain-containing protein [Bacteroidia bacterium]NNK28976.1 CHASE2 domain-containing protein [Flavobacteriaceae bacterium]